MCLRSGAGRETGVGALKVFKNCFEPVVEGIQTTQITYTHTYMQFHTRVGVGEKQNRW